MQNSKMPQSCASCCNYKSGEREKGRSGKYYGWCAILKQGVSPYGIPCMAFIQKREEGR